MMISRRINRMDYIIVKHYIAELDQDYREINMDKLRALLNKMKLYATIGITFV